VHRRDEANEYYQKEIHNQITYKKYLSASKIFQFKMNDEMGARHCLLTGWRTQADAKNCLLSYLEFFDKKEDYENALVHLFKKEVNPANQSTYLGILEHSFTNRKIGQDLAREQAYKIIAQSIHANKKLAHKLELFNPGDKQIYRDTSRFLRRSE
jgi:hypothetical protein